MIALAVRYAGRRRPARTGRTASPANRNEAAINPNTMGNPSGSRPRR